MSLTLGIGEDIGGFLGYGLGYTMKIDVVKKKYVLSMKPLRPETNYGIVFSPRAGKALLKVKDKYVN